jgi:hypothetical protein
VVGIAESTALNERRCKTQSSEACLTILVTLESAGH